MSRLKRGGMTMLVVDRISSLRSMWPTDSWCEGRLDNRAGGCGARHLTRRHRSGHILVGFLPQYWEAMARAREGASADARHAPSSSCSSVSTLRDGTVLHVFTRREPVLQFFDERSHPSLGCDRLTWKHYRFHVRRESHGKPKAEKLSGDSSG